CSLVALLLCACHTTSEPAPMTPPVAPPEATVTFHVAVDPARGPAARGTLFVSWLTEAEKQAFDSGKPPIRLVRDVIVRGVVASDVDTAQNAAFKLPAARGRIALIAALDVSHVGLAAIGGEGKGTLVGSTAVIDNGPAGAAAMIALASHPPPDRPEACQGD